MELRDYIQIVRRSWVLILAIAVAGVVVAGVISLVSKPVYTSTASVYFSIQSNDSDASQISSGATYVQNQIKSFSEIATSTKVLQPVIDSLGLDTTVTDLAETVTASAPLDSSIIAISVERHSPGEAATIANAVSTQLVVSVEELTRPKSGESPVQVGVITPAIEPSTATSPNIKLNLVLGVLVGLVIGLAIAVLRQVLDTRVRGQREVQEITDSTILGAITFDSEAKERPLVVQVSPQSPRAEAFRQLRTNLQFVEVTDEGRTFIVTSSVPSEGKSTTSVNLAITLAEAGAKVLLIDGDLRRPKVAQYMGIEGTVGLTDHLIGRATLDDVIQPWGAGNLNVLPAGQVPPNPSEILGSKAMIALLAQLDREYDTVIIDAPPLLPVTDAAILARLVSGGAMMVVASNKTTKAQLAAAINNLSTVGGRMVGVILNFLPVKGATAYGYGYYGYAPAGSDAPKRTPAG